MDLIKKTLEVEFNEKQPVLERWEKIGFLEGIPNQRKNIVANNFEKMAWFVLETNISLIIFPVIRKIMEEDETITDIDITRLFTSICSAHEKMKPMKLHNSEYDIDAELCIKTVKEYLKQ